MTNAERIQANSAELQECLSLVKNIVKPSGTLTIDTNGIHDVTAFESVDVNVSSGNGGTDIERRAIRRDANTEYDFDHYGTMYKKIENAYVPDELTVQSLLSLGIVAKGKAIGQEESETPLAEGDIILQADETACIAMIS